MKKFPGEITSRKENEKHAVRCCDETGSTCISPTPCILETTFEEAQNVCSDQGLQLCPINEKLPSSCCETGCEIDPITMWLRDIRGSGRFLHFSSSNQINLNDGKWTKRLSSLIMELTV